VQLEYLLRHLVEGIGRLVHDVVRMAMAACPDYLRA
jgi:hypothetical protein